MSISHFSVDSRVQVGGGADASPSATGGAAANRSRGALIECMLALCRQFSAERQHKVIECIDSDSVLHPSTSCAWPTKLLA